MQVLNIILMYEQLDLEPYFAGYMGLPDISPIGFHYVHISLFVRRVHTINHNVRSHGVHSAATQNYPSQ